MGLKPSRYNFFFDSEDGNKLAFNAYTTALALMSKEELEIAQEILKAPDNFRFNSKKKRELRDNLKKGGFLIEEEDDEFEALKVRNRTDRFSTSNFGLTIVPTLNCNFNCFYCYEEKKKIDMREEVEKALVKFVRQKTKNVRSFGVSWYGGEPTLRIDQIIRLTKKFKRICRENGCSYSASIVSNGYLLDREMAKTLKRFSLNSVQITIDGSKDIHDKRRHLRNGKGTFDKIIENIRNIQDILKVSIRVNVDKDNKDRIFELFDFIQESGLKDKISINIGQVKGYTDTCIGIQGNCFSDSDFAEFKVFFLKKIMEKGFSPQEYPKVRTGASCTADRLNSFVITPDGNIFKCWTEVAFSEENSIGNILKEPNPNQKRNWRKWLLWDPYENPECIECNILPICNGGCPYMGYKMKEEGKGNQQCVFWKYNLEKIVKLTYLNFQSQLKQKRGEKPKEFFNQKSYYSKKENQRKEVTKCNL
ncbi:MAG: radical SAM protein [Acidobacteriota bacterium]